MGSRRQRGGLRPRWSVGRLVLLVAVLAGLFFMHGLAVHGTVGRDQTMVAPQESAHDDRAPRALDTVEIGAASAGSTSVGFRAPGHEMDGMALCLAVLLSGLLLLLARRVLRPAFVFSRSRHLDEGRPPSPLRAADPPSLIALSILRC